MDAMPRDGGGEQIVTQPGNTTSAGAVISRIETIMESILDSLAEGKELCISLTADREDQTAQKIHFPGRCAQEATRFGTHYAQASNLVFCVSSCNSKLGYFSSCSSPTTLLFRG